MTAEEALNMIDAAIARVEWEYPMDYAIAFDMAKEALEKQVPMPVRLTTATKRCGRCGRHLSGIGNSHPGMKYCQKCGQAIRW